MHTVYIYIYVAIWLISIHYKFRIIVKHVELIVDWLSLVQCYAIIVTWNYSQMAIWKFTRPQLSAQASLSGTDRATSEKSNHRVPSMQWHGLAHNEYGQHVWVHVRYMYLPFFQLGTDQAQTNLPHLLACPCRCRCCLCGAFQCIPARTGFGQRRVRGLWGSRRVCQQDSAKPKVQILARKYSEEFGLIWFMIIAAPVSRQPLKRATSDASDFKREGSRNFIT